MESSVRVTWSHRKKLQGAATPRKDAIYIFIRLNFYDAYIACQPTLSSYSSHSAIPYKL